MTRDPSSLSLQDPREEAPRERRTYRKPELIAYGRVEDMTRAGKKSGKEASKKPRSTF